MLTTCFSQAYAVILGGFNAFTTVQQSRIASFHLSLLSFTTFAVYAYRDLWPLLTFTLRPADEAEGKLLWIKVTLALLAGIVLPALEPYPYIPVDPTDPFPIANPEQTASLFSFLFYLFVEPIVLKASRVKRLGADELPPLSDFDAAKNLIKQSYRHLDPFSGAPKRHLFFGLVATFRVSLAFQLATLLLCAAALIAGPIGTNRLLTYLESGGEGAVVKPWVWILLIAASPITYSLLWQLNIYSGTHVLVRIEAIITSLVFDHALRVQLKAETSDDPESSEEAAPRRPASDAKGTTTVEQSSHGEHDDTDTLHSQGATAASSTAADTTDAAEVSKVGSKDSKQNAPKKKDNFMGKVQNLVTSDLDNITVVSAPLHLALGMWFLYVVLGWSSFVGLGVMVALCPAPAWVATLTNTVQKQKMKATDARVQNVTEMMSVLRMIKLFGWETRVRDSVAEKREEELKWIWKRKLLGMFSNVANHTIPLIHMVVTYGIYTAVQGKPLTASIVFSSMSAFNMIRTELYEIFSFIPLLIAGECSLVPHEAKDINGFIAAHVSLGRVAEFLRETELLDSFTEKSADEIIIDSSAEHKSDIGFGHATFSWSNDTSDGTLTPSRQAFRLHIDDELKFRKGAFNLIIGPTGSGKTSMLMALLGEMHYIPSGPESWTNLPREGGVAYAAQESWVQNETIKENIIFGSSFDEDRYQKVIYQCGLTRDLSLFEAGDATEVGEKGLTLSGGQKARVTLARAVYSRAEIVLLDDVLAALDVHTSRWIVDKCFKGDLLRGRTILLVTHNVAMAGPLADFVVSLNTDGRIVSQGSVSDAITEDQKLRAELVHEEEAIQLDKVSDPDATPQGPAEKGKLVVAEEVAIGHVSWDAFKLFLSSLGGRLPALFWIGWITGMILSQLFDVSEMWWLGHWARQYSTTEPSRVAVSYYLSMYCLLVLLVVLTSTYAELLYTIATLRSSRVIHDTLVTKLLGSTFRWLDVTPTSRVIARCTQDIQAVDGQIAGGFNYLAGMTVSMLTQLGAVVLYTPTFILPAILIAIIGGWLGNIYLRAQLSVKREMSNAKAPVIGILSGAITGLTSIRAYAAQDTFRLETWISVRIDALAAVFSSSLAFYLVYGGRGYTPSNIGFILNMASSFSGMILWWVRLYNDVEVNSNSLERIHQYVVIEQEPEPKDGGVPPAYWPSSGKLEVENLTARYSSDGPTVLRDVSFRIEAGERVGIVGRTGSGKSTLTLALLRCIFTEGTVKYDGIATDSLNLDALRSNVTIIPQVPELLSGTLRHNLDVFGQFDDSTLNDALRAAGLFSLQRLSDENRLTLDTEIASGGGNLSVGQRQIIALARAIVRQSKLLILDEATSAIDYETDAVIQESLRNELKSDVTVITVAHRLQTIMDSDKVMVLDAGRLIEFDSPKELLRRPSLLRALVDESADREALYAMAEDKAVIGMSWVNRTIDDQNGDSVTGEQVSYSPSQRWSQGNGCGGCSAKPDASQTEQQTWHDGSRNPSRDPPITVSFKFTGTAVYLYNILSRGDLTEVSISIDGNFAARYSNRPDPSTQFLYHVPVFVASNLAFGEHSVEMSADGSDQTLVLFDYALYTTTESGNPPSSPPSPTSESTNTNTVEGPPSASVLQPTVTSNSPEGSPSSTTDGSSSITSLPSPTSSAPVLSASPSLSVSLSVLSQMSTVTVNGQVVQLQSSGASTGSSSLSPVVLATQALGSDPSHSGHTNMGAIVGGIVGAVVLLLACLFAFLWRRRRRATVTPFDTHKPGISNGYSDQRKESQAVLSSEVSLLHSTTYAEQADSESVVSHHGTSPMSSPSSASEALLQRELQTLQNRLAEARVSGSKSALSTTVVSDSEVSSASRLPKSSSSGSSVEDQGYVFTETPARTTGSSGDEVQRLRAEIEELRTQQQLELPLVYAGGLPSSTLSTNPSANIVATSPVEVELMRQITILRNEMERMRMQQDFGMGDEALPSYSPPSRPIPGYNAPPV
ncbi:hypothetical protein BC629DRAFT_1595092 [Irpex lacteus]|nr:hypothetical protein BC629DRAFT_1595092 [Irpex lacteus]